MLEENLRAFVSEAVQIWVRSGGTYAELSEMAGVNGQTIKRLANNTTKRPTFRTVEAVVQAFGAQISMQKTASKVEPKRRRSKPYQ